jgi:hypothetical protein
MRTVLFALLSLSAATLAAQNLTAQDARIEEVGKSPVAAKFASGGRIRMDLCPSGAELYGRDDNMVRVTYYHQHDDNVKVVLAVSGDRADLRITGCPRNNFQMTIEVPKTSGLWVRMPAGQLDVRGVTGDKDMELHAGQLTIEIGKPEDMGHVEASVLTGELDAPAFEVNKGGLFRSFEHTGPGKYRVHAHVGAGELDLR